MLGLIQLAARVEPSLMEWSEQLVLEELIDRADRNVSLCYCKSPVHSTTLK